MKNDKDTAAKPTELCWWCKQPGCTRRLQRVKTDTPDNKKGT